MYALLCTDVINDLVHPKGKHSHGSADFVETHRTLQRINRIQNHFRDQGHLVLHTTTAFRDNHAEYPAPAADSPIFTPELKESGAFVRGTWGTDMPTEVAPQEGEPVIVKHRLGAFDRTRLELILRTQGITELFVVGGFTSRSITAIALMAHDADFKVTVLADGCFDQTDEDHTLGQKICAKVAKVTDFDQIALQLT